MIWAQAKEPDDQQALWFYRIELLPTAVPAMRVVSEKPAQRGETWDVSPYGLAVAPTLFAPWRRGWGLVHLDQDSLVPRRSYDYRIAGTVPRRDRDASRFDLHTVPRGYRLPRSFRWGDRRGLARLRRIGGHRDHRG